MNTPSKGRTFRPATFEDIEAAAELFNARSRFFYGEDQIEAEKMLGWWKASQLNLKTDTWSCWDEQGKMIGWAEVENPGSPHVQIECGVILHPIAMTDAALWDELIQWSEARCRKYVPRAPEGARVAAIGIALLADEHRQQAWLRNGYEQVRISNRMRIDFADAPASPKPVWPAGIELHPFDREQDLERLITACREAFRDHWGYVEQPFEEDLTRRQEWIENMGKDFDPLLWFVAVHADSNEFAGFCLCNPQISGDPTRGYVASFGVRDSYRKQGLGLALLQHAFAELRHRGKVAVELDMDAENLTGALRLYTRAGMRPIRQLYTYEKELRPGTDLVRRSLDL